MAEIVLDRVSKRFADGTLAVAEASFTIADGELFVLVGPSGCGKSTLLNLIVGLETVSAGEVRVDGRVVNDLDPRDRDMAMVFQSYALYPHLTVRENLAFPLRIARVPAPEIERRVQEAATALELTAWLERRPASLSGGQRQRVAMGRALVRKPSAFLLDEPLSNLDARLRSQTRAELARLQRRLGTTMVYVTHDQTEAITLGDRIAVLRGGRVQQVGSPRSLYERPANLFVAGFIGLPAMSFLPGEVREGRLRLPFGELVLPGGETAGGAGERRAVVVGIRPEHFRPARPEEDGASDGPAFEVTVEVAEWLGADLYVHFEIPVGTLIEPRPLPPELAEGRTPSGTYRAVARLDGGRRVAEGDRLRLTLDPSRVHLFDAQSAVRLDPSPGSARAASAPIHTVPNGHV